jgi:uncharacterized protein (TIGR02680 family)
MSDLAIAERWRPARAGIRNIWEYDDQVFEFADGRLVLRGPNGSGKSNALALLVPFLLDGIMSALRMDSLGGGRSMKTLLLSLSEDDRAKRFRHEQRTGYVWLEFRRGDDYRTIGCGARASIQREAEAWFFLTSQRPGVDLDLAPGGLPLSKAGLAQAVGPSAVYDSADSYRAAVDRALLGLGAHRYRNLVELLLVLRRPHLAGRLNLEQLSKVLSDGLAALDDRLIEDVAASFEDLDAVQDDLRRLQDAHRAVRAFLPVYRHYVRSSARTRAEAATEADRALRAARRRVAETERKVADASEEVEHLQVLRVACDEAREIADHRQRAVIESPSYRDAKSLAEVEDRVAHDEIQLGQAQTRREAAQNEHLAASKESADADEAVRQASAETTGAFDEAGAAADLAGVVWPLSRDQAGSVNLASVLRGFGGRRRQDIQDVRAALAEADGAIAHATAAREASDLSRHNAERADEARHEAAERLDQARSELAEQLERWAAAGGIAELAAVVDRAATVGEPEAPTLADALADVLRPIRDELTARNARLELAAASISGEQAEVAVEHQRLADDPVTAPERLPTRPADRSHRPGAPLYACCDFADSVPPDERAGLEAALEAAGLLDAWVGGASDDLDAWALGGTAVAGLSLADVLVTTPPEGSGITEEMVGDILGSIALVEAGVAVLADGQFHLGPLSGKFAKKTPEFIGATAREQRRQRLLAELDVRLEQLAVRLQTVQAERDGIVKEHHHLDEVSASLPASVLALTARDALLSAVATAREASRAATQARVVASDAQRAAEERRLTCGRSPPNGASPRLLTTSSRPTLCCIPTSRKRVSWSIEPPGCRNARAAASGRRAAWPGQGPNLGHGGGSTTTCTAMCGHSRLEWISSDHSSARKHGLRCMN